MVASVLSNSNTFEKMKKCFELAGIPFVPKLASYCIQGKYFFGVANEAWLNERGKILNAIKKGNSCCLSGDGTCNSPWHNAKYLTYSFLHHSSNDIAGLVATKCTEACNLIRMEKYAFEKLFGEMQNNEIKISQITTDRHAQIKNCNERRSQRN